MTEDLLLPNFLGIGVVKAGTTWLHRNLYEHPELYLPLQKPVFFWDRHLSKGLESYARIFEPGRELLRGEFTASYSVLTADTKRRLWEAIPDLKLILMLREPRSRAWSEAKMDLTLIQEREKESLEEDDYLEFLRSEKCRERGDYASILRAWSEVFPRENLHVGLYDDIIADPRKVLTEVFEFLGVEVPDDWSDYPFTKRIFRGPEIQMSERCRALLEDMYRRPEIEEVAELAGLDLVRAWNYA